MSPHHPSPPHRSNTGAEMSLKSTPGRAEWCDRFLMGLKMFEGQLKMKKKVGVCKPTIQKITWTMCLWLPAPGSSGLQEELSCQVEHLAEPGMAVGALKAVSGVPHMEVEISVRSCHRKTYDSMAPPSHSCKWNWGLYRSIYIYIYICQNHQPRKTKGQIRKHLRVVMKIHTTLKKKTSLAWLVLFSIPTNKN